MAEPLRIVETAPPGDPPPSLPHNIEAEAALLGALMIDNRLAEDVQMKLRPDHFFEPLHGRIYESILRMIDRNMIASPVTLRPMFDADEAMKLVEAGGVENLHLAFYKNQDLGNDGVWDVWQVEGPHMVWYFRGAPHVHTWVNIKDPKAKA